jgi:hypothetical protein
MRGRGVPFKAWAGLAVVFAVAGCGRIERDRFASQSTSSEGGANPFLKTELLASPSVGQRGDIGAPWRISLTP